MSFFAGSLTFKAHHIPPPPLLPNTDMRQDQLVVQLIDLCDRLFKKDGNLDLKLTPYKIVCLSRNCGKKNIKVVVGRSVLFF